MPILRYTDADNQLQEKAFTKTIYIGTEPRQATQDYESLMLPISSSPGVRAEHALITRSGVSLKPILVDLCGQDTRVNGVPIQELKVLQHGNVIYLDRTKLEFREIQITRLRADSADSGAHCPLCGDLLSEGEETIVCPRYRSVLHRECWFSTRSCPDNGCNYPNFDITMDSLAVYPWRVKFERKLDNDSSLVKEAHFCAAGGKRDNAAYQPGDTVVYCPGRFPYRCNVSYHLECWLALSSCAHCGFDVQAVLNEVFGTVQEITILIMR